MGFHMSIVPTFRVCSKTGKPYYFGPNLEVIYGREDLTVPEEHRRFLHEKNFVYIAYKPSESQVHSVDSVCADFPTWEKVKENFGNTEDYRWTEKDHDAFYNALMWFSMNKSFCFVVYWG